MNNRKNQKINLERLKELIGSNPKNDNKTNYEVCKGLSEVCIMLSNSKESSEEQKKRFIQFSEMFSKFANFHKLELNQKEVQMQNQKSRKDLLLEEKRKKVIAKQEEDKKVREIISEIRKLEKTYPQMLVERACFKYKSANMDKRNAEKEMKELETKLEEAKRRLK